ncbi:MAG: 50S ribosomal protein L3 [Firmicutes bacterium]|nr:50S ribosomal protein L3 [Bacillota bacterium]
MKTLLGKKIGMTQVFTPKGQVVPVTVLQAGPCTVVQCKTAARDGYTAIQIGFGDIAPRKVNKPLSGHYEKAGLKPNRYLQEFRVPEGEAPSVGTVLQVDVFSAGDLVDVSGLSRGKGFAGVIKRWGFHRGPMAHGSKYHRRVGSLGALGPYRVLKGRKMPGRMGGKRVTVQNLSVVGTDVEKGLILVKGAVPGPRGNLLRISKAVKVRS